MDPSRSAPDDDAAVCETRAVDTDQSDTHVRTAIAGDAHRQHQLIRFRRRRRVPVILFLITAISTFWAGSMCWLPSYYLTQAANMQSALPLRRAIIGHWQDGLIYMVCVLSILLTHEMGHFLATLYYKIPASLPYFLPFPISPIGTMGAVIGMDGARADRKEIFDIGIAGPLAGLAIALPVTWIGIQQMNLTEVAYGPLTIDAPLLVRFVSRLAPPAGYHPGVQIWFSHLNPYFMAGWVGLLITGLNMMPVSQLDGGHIIYALFGRKAHWVARGFMVSAIAYAVYTSTYVWIIMIVLVLLIGTDHPPTRDDRVRLGWGRILLGWASLSIPLLCFPPQVFVLVGT